MDGAIFRKYSSDRIKQYTERIAACLGRLSTEQIWARGSENENAIGNLVLHLCGNVRQWIGYGVAGDPDIRQRDAEFSARGGMEAKALAALLHSVVSEAAAQIEAASDERLNERVEIQKYNVTRLEAILQVITHFGEHTGQIIFATKIVTGDDLAFYAPLKKPAHKEAAGQL